MARSGEECARGNKSLRGTQKQWFAGNLRESREISSINPADFDVAIAAIGERPYTEMMGDIVMGEDPIPIELLMVTR